MTSDRGPEVTIAVLLSQLGDWSGKGRSLYVSLAGALEGMILRGDLAPGTKLPAERVLATSLAVSRGTVMNTYELLRDRGLVDSRQGSGTHVRVDAPRPLLPDLDGVGPGSSSRSLSGRFFDPNTDVIDMAVSVLHDSEPLRDELLPTSWRDVQRAGAGHGYAPQGLLSLREQVCSYYQDRGLRTDPTQITVTGGAQQALDLASALALRPGDRVLVESPTAPGPIDTFARHGARIETIPFESHWERPQALRDAVTRYAPRIIYLMPGMHNPIGRPLPEGRRRDIARLADEHRLYVVEDNTLADTAFVPRDQALLAAYSKQDRVLTLGSLSKSAWGGLRVGWIRSDSGLASRMARIKAARDLGVSTLPQMAAQAALAELDTILSYRRAQMSGRCQVVQAELRAHLPTWAWVAPEGGLSLWVQLPTQRAEEFAQFALRRGVAVIAGSAHCLDGSGQDRLRLSFSQPEPVLIEGVRRLARAWQEFTGSAAVPAADTDVVELADRRRQAATG